MVLRHIQKIKHKTQDAGELKDQRPKLNDLNAYAWTSDSTLMTPKEIAAHYNAKVFDTPAAATAAGFVLTDTFTPRNVWNKASATNSIILKLVKRKAAGEIAEIGLVLEPWSVTGCYAPANN